MSNSKDSNVRTLTVALVLCLICSVMVSAVAVGLKSQQAGNVTLDQNKNVLIASGLATETTSKSEIEKLSADFKPYIINTTTGQFATAEEIQKANITDINTYDADVAAKHPGMGTPVENDVARVKAVPILAKVFIKMDASGKPEIIALPVRGYGLWGIIYGYLALEGDMNTVKGVSFYQHKETAGLGSRITEPQWRAQWEGKKAYDEQGNITVGVVKNGTAKPNPNYIDGVSGATITSNGVGKFMQFWLSDKGYKPFLDNLKNGKAGTPANTGA